MATSTPLNGAVNYTPSFSTEQYDDGNNFSANVFNISQTGVYKLDAFYSFTIVSAAAAFTLTAAIQNNVGLILAANTMVIPSGFSGTVYLNVSAITKILREGVFTHTQQFLKAGYPIRHLLL
ncbi:MAG: hypothetical protein WKF88_09185 [Ferruginibacter sp.]